MGEVEVPALRGFTLDVQKQEFLAIMGASGSGKSTAMNMIGALDIPTRGTIKIEGKDITHFTESQLATYRGQKIGFIFQFFNLYSTLTALENVELPMMIIEKGKKERRKRALELLKLVGLEKRAEHLPSQLSGGERQRVAIARTLAIEPEILLLDEITSALDPVLVNEMLKTLRMLAKDNRTLVIVTHEMGFAREISDRIIFLHKGRIAEQGHPWKMFSNPENEATRTFINSILTR